MSKSKKKVDPTYTEPVLPENIDELKAFALKAHADLYEKTKRCDSLCDYIKQLGDELDTLRDANEARRAQALHDLQIRQKWQQTAKQLCTCLKKTIGDLPMPVDTYVFEADDWERIDNTQALIQRLLTELQQLKNARFVEFTQALTYVEANNER